MKWTPYKLDELGFVGRGKSKHRPRNDPILYNGNYPFIQTGNVKASNLYIYDSTQTYNEIGLNQSNLWNEGTLCITIAANIAETAILGAKACFPDSIIGFIPDKSKTTSEYIKYYIDYIKVQMQSISQGTTQDNLSAEKLLSFNFILPDLLTQKNIASILFSYDNLIENNSRRITILDETAQKLYREWFVKFRFPGHEDVKMVESELGLIPEGWDVVKLSDIAKVNPESITVRTAPETIKYVDISSVGTGKIDNLKEMLFSEAPSRARRKVSHQDIIWATVRPNRKQYAYIVNPEENTIVSTGFAVIRAEKVPSSYLYFAVTTDNYVSYLVNNASGSAYPAVNAGEFNNSDIIKPTSELLQQYAEIVDPLLLLIKILSMKNRNLKKQRDLLLPKLISGKINV